MAKVELRGRLRSQGAGSRLRFGWARRCSMSRTGAGRDRIIVLVLDNAGRHTEPGLAVPEGVRLVHLPPYSPERQPAECLWPVPDEPLADKHFRTIQDLDRAVAERCVTLDAAPDLYKGRVDFHWWPKPTTSA